MSEDKPAKFRFQNNGQAGNNQPLKQGGGNIFDELDRNEGDDIPFQSIKQGGHQPRPQMAGQNGEGDNSSGQALGQINLAQMPVSRSEAPQAQMGQAPQMQMGQMQMGQAPQGQQMQMGQAPQGQAQNAQGNATPGLPIEHILEQITTMMRDPVSRDVIRAGLPLVEGLISPRAHERAIKQAGLKASQQKTFKDGSPAPTPFLIPLPSGRVMAGIRWNMDGSLDVMGLEPANPGEPLAVKQIPQQRLDRFLPKKVMCIKRVAKSVRKSSDNRELTGLNRFETWFWPIIRAQWKGYVYACIAVIIVNLMTVLGSFYALAVYDRVVPNLAFDTLTTLTIGVMIAHTFGFIVKNLQAYFLDTSGRKIDSRVSSDLFARVMGMKSKDRPRNSGSFAQTFRDFENVREFFSSVTMSSIVEIPFSFLFIFAIYIVAGPLALIPLVLGPLLIVIALGMQVWVGRAIESSMQAGAEKNAVLIESLSGIESIKSLTSESVFQQRWEDAVEVSSDSTRLMRLVTSISTSLSQYISMIASVLVLVFGVILMSNQGITMGGIIASTMLTSRALQPFMKVSGLLVRYQQTKMSLSVIQKISEQENERAYDPNHIDHPIEEGSVSFQKVTFQYPETATPVISDVSFDIRAGERVGIIGASGSGKSTLSKLILGLFEPDNGAIQISGVDNRQYNPRTLRRAVAYSPQDPFIFGGSVVENIRFGNDQASNQDILNAAKAAGVHIFTANHPDGMSMQVGELGRNLSGGQRQALSLARTFVKESKILVLDEPTNSLDGQSEAILLDTLKNMPDDRTLVLITHRPNLLSKVDRLICMERGKVIMDGARQEVIDRLSKSRNAHAVMGSDAFKSRPAADANKLLKNVNGQVKPA